MLGSAYEQIRDELAQVPRVRRQPGRFIGQDGNLGIVEVGDQTVRIPMVGYLPHPGTPVWVETQNGRTVCTGSSYQFSPYGTILSAPAGNLVRVQPDDGPELTLPYRSGLSLSSGNRVEINPVTRVVQGLISMVPAPPAAEGGSGSGTTFRDLLVQATESGTSNGGSYWQNNVNCDSAAGGAWFYGSRLVNALKGATLTRVELFLPRIYSNFSAPTLRLHGSATRPGSGLPSFNSSHNAGAASGWIALPLSWGDAMRDAIQGVGFAPTVGVFASWRGTSADSMSGALRFAGTR